MNYSRTGQYEKAVNALAKALEIDPNSQDALCNLGGTYHFLGKTQDAIDHLERALEIDRNHAPTLNNLGHEYEITCQTEKAVKCHIDYFCGRAIKTDLSKDSVDPYLYDRDAGQGTFQKVVDSILSEMETQE